MLCFTVNKRISCLKVFYKTDILKNFAKFTGKHLCQSLFSRSVTSLKKETVAQLFSCEFCEIFKNSFFYKTPPVAASVIRPHFISWLPPLIHCSLHICIWKFTKIYLKLDYHVGQDFCQIKVFPSLVQGSTRGSHWRCSVKKVFFKISPNLQESTYTGTSFLI